jgi:hypothetical protein
MVLGWFPNKQRLYLIMISMIIYDWWLWLFNAIHPYIHLLAAYSSYSSFWCSIMFKFVTYSVRFNQTEYVTCRRPWQLWIEAWTEGLFHYTLRLWSGLCQMEDRLVSQKEGRMAAWRGRNQRWRISKQGFNPVDTSGRLNKHLAWYLLKVART